MAGQTPSATGSAALAKKKGQTPGGGSGSGGSAARPTTGQQWPRGSKRS